MLTLSELTSKEGIPITAQLSAEQVIAALLDSKSTPSTDSNIAANIKRMEPSAVVSIATQAFECDSDVLIQVLNVRFPQELPEGPTERYEVTCPCALAAIISAYQEDIIKSSENEITGEDAEKLMQANELLTKCAYAMWSNIKKDSSQQKPNQETLEALSSNLFRTYLQYIDIYSQSVPALRNQQPTGYENLIKRAYYYRERYLRIVMGEDLIRSILDGASISLLQNLINPFLYNHNMIDYQNNDGSVTYKMDLLSNLFSSLSVVNPEYLNLMSRVMFEEFGKIYRYLQTQISLDVLNLTKSANLEPDQIGSLQELSHRIQLAHDLGVDDPKYTSNLPANRRTQALEMVTYLNKAYEVLPMGSKS